MSRKQIQSSAPLITYREEYNCPKCAASLPRECVKLDVDQSKRLSPMRSTLSIYCTHCKSGFRSATELDGGVHRIVGSVEPLTGKDLAEMKHHIASICGDRIIEAVEELQLA